MNHDYWSSIISQKKITTILTWLSEKKSKNRKHSTSEMSLVISCIVLLIIIIINYIIMILIHLAKKNITYSNHVIMSNFFSKYYIRKWNGMKKISTTFIAFLNFDFFVTLLFDWMIDWIPPRQTNNMIDNNKIFYDRKNS